MCIRDRNFIATPHLGASTLEAQENVAVQVAEQMADYLLTGAVTNALNTPSISAEEAPRLKPFVDLMDKLGRLMGQLLRTSVTSVEFTYQGPVSDLNTKPMTAAALSGLLAVSMPGANMVSAPTLAKERGIEIKESTLDDDSNDSLLKITLDTGKRKFVAIGGIHRGEPRITRLFGVPMSASFAPHMLYVRNEDKPGFIAALGRTLAAHKINIAELALGRMDNGEQEAVCLVAVDTPVPDSVVSELEAIDQVKIVNAVSI